jgi:hypothetical protein
MSAIRTIAVSAVLAAGLAQAGVASAHQQDVQVIRGGGQSATISEVREARVQVFRGAPAATLAVLGRDVSGDKQAVEIVSSGSKIWFVDRAASKLSVCRLVKTTQVGEHRIDCESRTLPR